MFSKVKKWLPKFRHLILRVVLTLICSIAVGVGYSLIISDQYLPTMDGNVYAMDPTGNSLFMVLSKEANNSLVHIDYSGNLLHYAVTESNQAFENLVVLDDTIYAVLTTYDAGVTTQTLVSLSMNTTHMPMRVLMDLTSLPEVAHADITWTGAYLPLGDDPQEICLGGVDEDGCGYLLHWNLATERADLEHILVGESLYKLKYVDDGRYVWIDREGRLGQYIDGVWQRDLLADLARSPNHVSTYQDQVFIADSSTGDVYELSADGSVELRWSGTDEIRGSGYRYEDITIFTTSPDSDGEIQVIGLCAAKSGTSNVVVGPNGTITELSMGGSRLWMVIQHAWATALICFLFLIVIVEVLRACLRSSRMAVRLVMGELVMATVMLGSVIGIQYDFYQHTIQEDAQQTLQLMGGNLADVLTSDVEMSNQEVTMTVQDVLSRVANSEQYTVNVAWVSDGIPLIGYDDQVPAMYHVEDVKSRGYYNAVNSFLNGSRNRDLQEIRNDMNVREYVYIQRITQEQWTGCVTVAQTESAILSGRSSFWATMIPILCACPFLFAALIFLTVRLLKPLGRIRSALVEFYDTGGGNQIDLEQIPKTELYEVSLVFNELSHRTKVQFNTLSHINDAYTRLVPDCLCQMLRKRDVLELSAGDYTVVDGAMLILVPETPARTAEALEALFQQTADLIADNGGMIIDYDEGLGSATAIFGDPEQAQDCARRCLAKHEDAGQRVMAAVFTEQVEFGVFGSEKLIYPLAVSGALHRQHEALSLLLGFGAVLVQSGEINSGALRLLGWDGETAYYEDPRLRPGSWRSQWELAGPLWAEAMELFREKRFAEAMRKFARVLRLIPEDDAARWYLFRCESLRDTDPAHPLDTGLLFNWRDRHG